MTFKTFVATILYVAMADSASAQMEPRIPNNPLIVWQGSIFVTAANATCVSFGINIGQYGLGLFRPRLDPAEPPSGFMIQYPRGNVLFTRTGGAGTDKMRGAGTFAGTWVGPTVLPAADFAATTNFVLTPQNPIATTDFITLTGSITNFDGITNCTTSVRGAFARRP